jgi:signal transduction histidine kinase
MLDISKIEAGQLEEFTLFPTDIKKAFWQIHDDILSIANEKNISLLWDVDIPDETIISIPADRYRQAIINLLGNAIKFTPEK